MFSCEGFVLQRRCFVERVLCKDNAIGKTAKKFELRSQTRNYVVPFGAVRSAAPEFGAR